MLQERFAKVIGMYFEFDLTTKTFDSSNDIQFIIENINEVVASSEISQEANPVKEKRIKEKPIKENPDGTRRKRGAAETATKQNLKMLRK